VGLPLISVGQKRKNRVVAAWGYTFMVIAFTLIQVEGGVVVVVVVVGGCCHH